MLSRAVAKFMVPKEAGQNLSKSDIVYTNEEKEAYSAIAKYIKQNLAASDNKSEESSESHHFEG